MKHLNLAAALTLCAVDAAIIGMIPLLGLLVLPCLFGSVCWAACAWRELEWRPRRTRRRLSPAGEPRSTSAARELAESRQSPLAQRA